MDENIYFARIGAHSQHEFRVSMPPSKHDMVEIPITSVQESDAMFIIAGEARRQTSTGHGNVIDLAAYRLKECLEQHLQCRPNKQPARYPTRLLHLRGDDVRLVDSGMERLSLPYATLSEWY